jgi:hypothetical protein
MDPSRDQARDVGDISHELRADRICDLAEALPVDDARVG